MWIKLNKSHLKLATLCLLAILLVHAGETEAEKEIPLRKYYNNAAPTITFLYCYSCGYRKAFEEYSNILHEKYPELQIKGDNYDPPGFSRLFSRAIMITKLVIIIAIMSSFDFFGMQLPSWWNWCTSNKVYSSMMVFFLGNMLESQLISSGAFEISFNDVPIWSKLQTGRIPAPQELFQILETHMNFASQIDKNPDFVK